MGCGTGGGGGTWSDGGRCGEDPRQRFAAVEARQAGCTVAVAVAGGGTFSADLGAHTGTERFAAVVDSSLQAGADSRAGEERAAASGDEPRLAAETEAVE